MIKTLYKKACGIFSIENERVVFVFGNQKSGTTAISALLSNLGKLSATLDIMTFTVEEQDMLHERRLLFKDFVKKHKKEFSNELIKEPALTFLYEEVKNCFTLSRGMFIIRDPRENIRSILNRVKVRGDMHKIDNFDKLPNAWQRIIDNRWMGMEYDHYIDSLAARWNRAANVYLEHADDMILVRYEDFMADKVGVIEQTAAKLGIEKRNDISGKVDIQYQPRGDRNISWLVFFGEENLKRITDICGEHMKHFGYKVNGKTSNVR